MRISRASMLLLALAIGCDAARGADMQESVNQAVDIIKRFEGMAEQSIPEEVLRDCKGLAIMTVIKAGFIFSARGDGLVVARTPNGWSGPAGIGTGGAGFGLQIGVQATEFVFVLNTLEAVKAFAHGNFALGADLSVAAGPVGRHLAAGVMPTAAVYTYSMSQGAFAGISVEGTGIIMKKERNAQYYGRPVEAMEILTGKVPPPPGTAPLIEELRRHDPVTRALPAKPAQSGN
jgi:lipid-binding SYLF domain-containing protein